MANLRYGINYGGTIAADVLIQAGATSRDVELLVVDTNLPLALVGRKLAIRRAVEVILNAMDQNPTG